MLLVTYRLPYAGVQAAASEHSLLVAMAAAAAAPGSRRTLKPPSSLHLLSTRHQIPIR